MWFDTFSVRILRYSGFAAYSGRTENTHHERGILWFKKVKYISPKENGLQSKTLQPVFFQRNVHIENERLFCHLLLANLIQSLAVYAQCGGRARF